MEFIHDRKQSHVNRLNYLNKKGYASLTAREIAEYNDYAAKGAYNYTDLNRVETAVAELAEMLGLSLETKTDWQIYDAPTASDMSRYLGNVIAVVNAAMVINPQLETKTLPTSMYWLTWETANNIEYTLEQVYKSLTGVM